MGVVNGTATPRSVSPAWISSVAGPFMSSPARLKPVLRELPLRQAQDERVEGPRAPSDRGLYAFPTGPDDRLDELAVRVLVPAVDEFGETVAPVRPVVVAAAEIERSDRIVCGPDRENANAARGVGGVADDGGFGGLQIIAEPAATVETRRRQRVWTLRLRRRGHDDQLLGAQVDQLVDQPDWRGRPGPERVRFPSPVPSGRRA